MKHKAKARLGAVCISLGLVFIAGSLLLQAYNTYDDHSAGETAADIVHHLQTIRPPRAEAAEGPHMPAATPLPLYDRYPEMDMPVVYLDEQAYVGTLTIPSLELNLPVASKWSYAALKISPCRYTGSVYRNNMVIAAHNYRSHFGRIDTLSPGDDVYFTDADGNEFRFAVAAVDVLSPYNVSAMTESAWDLSLFTCTYSGRQRITVRCQRVRE